METLTLLFFVLMLLVAGLVVTQTVRRELKDRERNEGVARRVPAYAPEHAAQRALHSPSLPQRTHKSPPRPL
jgi:hypothetical protein